MHRRSGSDQTLDEHVDPPWPAQPATPGAVHHAVTPDDPSLRIGDAERGEVQEVLAAHYGAGRLDQFEFERRVERTVAARTAGELAPVLADLPLVRTHAELAAAARERRRWALGALRGWSGLALLFVTIWLLTTPGGYFWPVWPILGTGTCTVPAAVAVLRRDAAGSRPQRR